MKETLEKIRQAEDEAAKIAEEAAEEARTIIKGVEEACAASSRECQKAARDAAFRIAEEARMCARDEINQLSVARSTQRELMRGLARTRMHKATAALVERIVEDGDR